MEIIILKAALAPLVIAVGSAAMLASLDGFKTMSPIQRVIALMTVLILLSFSVLLLLILLPPLA